jgi:hypothetical protein
MKQILLFTLIIALNLFSARVGAFEKKANRSVTTSTLLNSQVKQYENKDVSLSKAPSNEVQVARVTTATTTKPGVSYKVPQGTLFYGLSNDYYGYNSTFAVASPYVNWTFTNTSTDIPNTTFNWSLYEYSSTSSAYIASTKTLNTSDSNLSFDVTTESFYNPTLVGSASGLSDSTFIFGKLYSAKSYVSYIDAGGASYNNGTRTFHFTNYLKDLSRTAWIFDTNDFAFGTGTQGTDAVVAYYEKPQTTLYFEGANFFLGTFSAPIGATFTLRIITVDDSSGSLAMKDTVATSYATTADVDTITFTSGTKAYTMPFTSLVTVDADGLETELAYLELDDPFVLEVSWNNESNLNLGFFTTYYDGKYGDLAFYDNHAFIYAPYANNNNERTLLSYSWNATLVTSLTNAAYTYLVSDADTINFAGTGGNSSFTLVPYYNGVWINEDLPSWISAAETTHYVSGNWGTDITLTAEALPEGVSSRSADITFKTWGAKKVIHINQDISTGASNPETVSVYVAKVPDYFEIKNANNYNSVDLITMTGQVINHYSISASGNINIPTSSLENGIYLLKFVGNKSEVIKVIK